MHNPTDERLVERIVAGDEPALAEVFNRHSPYVQSFSRRILRNETLAEDVVQEVFLRLWNEPARYDVARGSLRSFLLAQSHGRAIDLLRSENARRMREQRDAAKHVATVPAVEERVLQLDVGDRVRKALLELDERQRRAIELSYFEGRSYRETATFLGLPEGTVKSQIRAGMRRLRSLLDGAMSDTVEDEDRG